ncbi:20357_t:CDS:2 [Funneliformis geosporum]|uniref:12706_t:CDS:1 n=1 Tax=Funneliformis geosporum TaxID=1117311 RepID=A0A9W4SMI7_9GLOM|nr:20357_t:CDS:2 [Funneliformis geosporum]CAI2174034.1 12706_t:CDS:2 [Funneliformis geosporum]
MEVENEESQSVTPNNEHSSFKYQNFRSQRSKKNRRGKKKWVVKENRTVDYISYVDEKRQSLLQSVFFQELQEKISNRLFPPHRPKLVDIVCYGIGSIERSKSSQFQFALMLILKDLFQITGKAYVYDPVLTSIDLDILSHYEISIIDINEKAKREITNQTLFYMPHCPIGLYNNVIASNWEKKKLEKIILVGNRLDFYNEGVPFPTIPAKYNDDHLLIQIPANIFNDLCWQWFPSDGELSNLDGNVEFWTSKTTLLEDVHNL